MRRAILPWIVVGAAAGAGCSKKTPEPAPNAVPAPQPALSPPPALAPKAACAPLPTPDADHETFSLDLDGDHVADALVPTDCDGRDNCTLHVFLSKDGCPQHLDDLEMVRGAPALLPLTSHGVALIATRSAVHAEADEAVVAWNGTKLVDIYDACTWLAPSHQADSTCDAALTDAARTVCLGGGAPSQTIDVDGDGTPDGIFDVPCAKAGGDKACGSWVLLARPGCLVPALVLPPGKVEVAAPAAHGKPARLRVSKQTFTPAVKP